MAVRVKQKNSNALSTVYEKMKGVTGKEVAVGFPAGKANAYPDGTPVAGVAAAHVYGIGVPKRDFMGLAQDEITERTAPIIAKALQLEKKDAMYEAVGLSAQAAIQNAIVALDDPPNAPATIARKKSANPLIDTGHMKGAVTYVVRDRSR